MPTQPAPASAKSGSILSNPLFLVGAGAVVLIALVANKSGGGSIDTSGATASAVQQALTEQSAANAAANTDQQAAILAALKDQSSTVNAQLAANAASVNDLLSQQQDAAPAAVAASAENTSQLTGLAALIAGLQSQLDALKKAGANIDPFPLAGTVDISPNSPNAFKALDWSTGAGLPFEWGLEFIQHYGRLPENTKELDKWFAQIGDTTSDGRKCINGACVPGPGFKGTW